MRRAKILCIGLGRTKNMGIGGNSDGSEGASDFGRKASRDIAGWTGAELDTSNKFIYVARDGKCHEPVEQQTSGQDWQRSHPCL